MLETESLSLLGRVLRASNSALADLGLLSRVLPVVMVVVGDQAEATNSHFEAAALYLLHLVPVSVQAPAESSPENFQAPNIARTEEEARWPSNHDCEFLNLNRGVAEA